MKRKTLARMTAEMIAAELFSYGPVQKASRLVMEFGTHLSGPGWCEGAIANKIEEVLERRHLASPVTKKKAKKG